MRWTYDDGGRKAAGYAGSTGDCVTRAIAIATQVPYEEVYDLINEVGTREHITRRKKDKSSARTGVYKRTTRRVIEALGWEWVPVMAIGKGCTMHLTEDELPSYPRMIVKLSRHVAAVIDGVVHDTHDPARDGTRCVYGYWIPAGLNPVKKNSTTRKIAIDRSLKPL